MAHPGRARELLRAYVHGWLARAMVIGRDVIGAGRVRHTRPAACSSLVVLAALAAAPPVRAATAFAPTRVDGGAGSTTAIVQWQIQESAKAQQRGDEVSSAGYATRGWYPVSGRATVVAGLLENGTYKNVFYGDNLRKVQPP